MFTLTKYRLSERDINNCLEESYFINALEKIGMSEQEASDIIFSVAEKANWDIDGILKDTIHAVDNEYLRDCIRRFLISQKYGILPRYPRGGTNQYAIMYASDRCVLVDSPHIIRNKELVKPTSTIVMSPEGEIMIPEGNVWINTNSLSQLGFNAKWNDLMGLYTESGKVLLPCIFEDLSNPIYCARGTMQYKGFRYSYTWRGVVSERESDKIDPIDSECGQMTFVCDNNIYSIFFLGYNDDGLIHKGAFSVARQEEDPFNALPEDEKLKLGKENIDELFSIIRSIHSIKA